MKHLTKLTLTSTTPENNGLKNRPRDYRVDLISTRLLRKKCVFSSVLRFIKTIFQLKEIRKRALEFRELYLNS